MRDPDAAQPWRQPVRGGSPDPRLVDRPGLDQLRLGLTSDGIEAPLNRLTGMRLEAVQVGSAVFSMPLTGWLTGADGAVAPGSLAIPADAAMACAVMSTLPARTPFTTSEMTLRLLQTVAPEGSVRAEGRVIATRSPAVLAEVSLSNDAGALIAHGSSLCVTLPAVSTGAQPWTPGVADPPGLGPDPWQQPVPDTPDGGLPAFTGLTGVRSEPGEVEYELPASGWYCAPPPGRLQGGVVTLLAEAAIFGAMRSVTPPGVIVNPVELKINLLRPLVSDGRRARAIGRLVHSGRRIAVAGSEVTDADGRAVAMATGSALLTGGATGSGPA